MAILMPQFASTPTTIQKMWEIDLLILDLHYFYHKKCHNVNHDKMPYCVTSCELVRYHLFFTSNDKSWPRKSIAPSSKAMFNVEKSFTVDPSSLSFPLARCLIPFYKIRHIITGRKRSLGQGFYSRLSFCPQVGSLSGGSP